jgi:hypothetical protein
MTMTTTMPIASRRAFVGLGAAVALSASARGATLPGLAAVPAHGKAIETRYRTIDMGGLEIFDREAGPGAAPFVLLLQKRCIMAKCHSLRRKHICPS